MPILKKRELKNFSKVFNFRFLIKENNNLKEF
jgi:hypothetical protein